MSTVSSSISSESVLRTESVISQPYAHFRAFRPPVAPIAQRRSADPPAATPHCKADQPHYHATSTTPKPQTSPSIHRVSRCLPTAFDDGSLRPGRAAIRCVSLSGGFRGDGSGCRMGTGAGLAVGFSMCWRTLHGQLAAITAIQRMRTTLKFKARVALWGRWRSTVDAPGQPANSFIDEPFRDVHDSENHLDASSLRPRNLVAGMRAGASWRRWRRSVERHGLFPWVSDLVDCLADPTDLMPAGRDDFAPTQLTRARAVA